MNYQALYRMYRPQSFDDVVGQEHVTKTLRNAISKGKQSHAYIFSGPRGTGKTSIAKVFAKAINCTNSTDGEPCNECAICKGITQGTNSDVIEIDAAVTMVLTRLEILEIKLNTHQVNLNTRFILLMKFIC